MWHKHLEVLLENGPVGYAYHKIVTNTTEKTLDIVFLKCNHLFEQIMGTKKSDMIHRTFNDLQWNGENRKIHRTEIYKNIALKGGYETFESYSKNLNRWYKVQVFSPQKGFFVTLFTDITTDKEKHKQLENFFDINLDLLCIADSEGKFVKLNKEWERLLGYDVAELKRRPFLDFVHPDDVEPTKEVMKKLGNNEDILNFTNRYLSKTGDYKIIEWRSHPHGDLIYAAARDITDNRAKEKEVTSILETTIDGFFIADVDGNITKVNSAFCNMLGYEKQELLSMNILDFEACETEDDIENRKQRILKKGFDRFQTKHRRKDGEVLDVEISVTVFTADKPKMVVFIRDITEQKKAQKKVEAAGKVKSEFLSNMSHEIRTPLNGIIGFTDLLKNTPLNPNQKRFLESIYSNANSLLNIVNDILDFSQIEEDKLQLKQTLSDVHALIQEAVASFQEEALKKSLDLIVTVDEHLPKFAYVDYARLKQVLINLLSNAVKFTENGQIELTVQFSALSEKTGEFFFSIKDTGIGMSHKQQNSIFKAFSQGDTSISKKFGGTGLGLIISQRIVQKMGSEIQFESERNKGSTFYFQLKANYKRTQEFENDSINEFNEESEPIKGVNHINHKVTNDTPTFLIVDDVETSRFLLSEYLKEFEGDIKILEAVNGKQAVEIIKREKPDLVLMDLFMPVLDGLKATKIIRDFEEKHQLKRTIIFALTATATKVQEQECYNMGMDAYLTKPLKKVQLYEKIHQFWKPKKSHGTSGADQALDISNDHELATLLNSLKEMLIKNDLSAIDFLENNERELESLGDADSLKKLKNQIINLKYQEALYDLNELIEASLKRQK